MFYFKSFYFLCMYMFMGIVSRIDKGLVASSSSVGGSGTLHMVSILFMKKYFSRLEKFLEILPVIHRFFSHFFFVLGRG